MGNTRQASKGYPCHHSTCESTSGTHIFCFLSSKMASERSRGTNTWRAGQGTGDGKRVCTFFKNYTDIITLQLFHLTPLSLPAPILIGQGRILGVGLFNNSIHSLFSYLTRPPFSSHHPLPTRQKKKKSQPKTSALLGRK